MLKLCHSYGCLGTAAGALDTRVGGRKGMEGKGEITGKGKLLVAKGGGGMVE
jgi:hypothetical protein